MREMRKINSSEEQIKMSKGSKSLPLVVTYYPLWKNLGRIMSKILSLNVNEETECINDTVTHGVIQEPS